MWCSAQKMLSQQGSREVAAVGLVVQKGANVDRQGKVDCVQASLDCPRHCKQACNAADSQAVHRSRSLAIHDSCP